VKALLSDLGDLSLLFLRNACGIRLCGGRAPDPPRDGGLQHLFWHAAALPLRQLLQRRQQQAGATLLRWQRPQRESSLQRPPAVPPLPAALWARPGHRSAPGCWGVPPGRAGLGCLGCRRRLVPATRAGRARGALACSTPSPGAGTLAPCCYGIAAVFSPKVSAHAVCSASGRPRERPQPRQAGRAPLGCPPPCSQSS
jgi:hypothetical protein